jgi:phosphohistidine phosphatase
MNIYLIRHGKAEDISRSKKDFDRELTADGIEKMKTAVKQWKGFIKNFGCIVTSPLIRARQTAGIIAGEYQLEKVLYTDNRLSCGSRAEDILDICKEFGFEDIAFVGHEPDFSSHVSELISSSGAGIVFKKGTIAKISFGSRPRLHSGFLEFLIPPSALK